MSHCRRHDLQQHCSESPKSQKAHSVRQLLYLYHKVNIRSTVMPTYCLNMSTAALPETVQKWFWDFNHNAKRKLIWWFLIMETFISPSPKLFKLFYSLYFAGGLFNYTVGSSEHTATNRFWLVNNEMKNIWKEEVTDPSYTLRQNLSAATKEKSNQTPLELQARCSTAWTNTVHTT